MRKMYLFIAFGLLLGATACKEDKKAKEEAEATIDVEALRKDTLPNSDSSLNTPLEQDSIDAENALILISKEILLAFKNHDFQRLANYVDATQGVLFYPYAYIDEHATKNHFSREEVLKWGNSNNKRVWGTQDGSGDPIKMSFREYLNSYVYDAPFLNTRQMAVNKSLFRKSNAIDNSLKVFANKAFVDYYLPSKDKVADIDWRNLRLIFNKAGNKYFLIAVVHHQWEI